MRQLLSIIFILLLLSLLTSCTTEKRTETANPASVKCIKDGYNLTIKTNSDGSQTGYCIFPNGKECEEWQYYREECKNE